MNRKTWLDCHIMLKELLKLCRKFLFSSLRIWDTKLGLDFSLKLVMFHEVRTKITRQVSNILSGYIT